MSFDFSNILNIILPVLTGLSAWLVARRKRDNDFLNDLQASVNLLSDENKKLLQELVSLRRENAFLTSGQEVMTTEIQKLREENKVLRVELEELNNRLSNVKTITRKA